MRHEKGFTLLELMITVVVVAILAGIALPSYNDYVLRSRFTEATGNLADLRVKMEQFYLDNRRYSVDPGTKVCGIPGVPDGNTPTVGEGRYFTYECLPDNFTGLGSQSYVLTARGIPGQGLGGISFTVNQANGKQTIVDPSSDMEKRGYGGANCWVRKKPADC